MSVPPVISMQKKISKRVVLKTRLFIQLGKMISVVFSAIASPFSLEPLKKSTYLMIEAGHIGWTSVFYTELRSSAADYVGQDKVVKSSIDRTKSYLGQSIVNLIKARPTHFLYDPRTGSQQAFTAVAQAFILAIVLSFLRISPIVILTDASVRQWRYQVFLITARRGVVITFLEPIEMGGLIPHNRIIGPMFMPISISTLTHIENMRKSVNTTMDSRYSVHFLGSLYSKRVVFFETLQSELRTNGSKASVKIEEKSDEIGPYAYWERMVQSDSVITTTFQERDPRYVQDLLEIDQLVFRVSESLAAGCLLFSSIAPGMEKFFMPNIDFIAYQSVVDLANKIDLYSQDIQAANRIASHGHTTYRELILAGEFWKQVDTHLEKPLKAMKTVADA
jgi:hypothetical protein